MKFGPVNIEMRLHQAEIKGLFFTGGCFRKGCWGRGLGSGSGGWWGWFACGK